MTLLHMMTRRPRKAAVLAAGLAFLFLSATGPEAQSFSPVAHVNDSVVTEWELSQRQRMLSVLNAPPEAVAASLDNLINERLQLQAAKMVGVSVSDDAINAGIDEFASRGNLTGEQFVMLLGNEGIDEATVRDFVRAGLAWRDAVRARFRGYVNVTPHRIAREEEAVRSVEGPRVLLTELVLPARNALERIESLELAEQLRRSGSLDAFSRAAEEYSRADSAKDGGRVDWIPLADLQGPIAAAISGLRPGQITEPVLVPDGVALYQIRSTRDAPPTGGDAVIDYVQYLIPGGRTEATLKEAERIQSRIRTCDELYRIANGRGGGQLIREEHPRGQIPADIGAQLDLLDRNEVSTNLTRGGALVFLMLCDRDAKGTLAIADSAVASRLENEELIGRANIWLAELKSEAFIQIGN